MCAPTACRYRQSELLHTRPLRKALQYLVVPKHALTALPAAHTQHEVTAHARCLLPGGTQYLHSCCLPNSTLATQLVSAMQGAQPWPPTLHVPEAHWSH